jgi:hypothetical protein
MPSAPDGDELPLYVKAALIPMNKFLGIRFIGGLVKPRPDLETLEKENTFIRAEDPTEIPLLSYP